MGKKSSQAWWNTCVISGLWRPSRWKLHPKKQKTQKTTKGGKKFSFILVRCQSLRIYYFNGLLSHKGPDRHKI